MSQPRCSRHVPETVHTLRPPTDTDAPGDTGADTPAGGNPMNITTEAMEHSPHGSLFPTRRRSATATPIVGPAVVLVDPVLTGQPFKPACADLGLPVIGVYTIEPARLAGFDPDYAAGDAVSIHAGPDPAETTRRICAAANRIVAAVPATEPAVHHAATLAAHLGVAHNPLRSARACRDKRAMRDLARDHGLAIPRYAVVSDAAAIPAAVEEIGFPAIVKPTTGAGSHNVTLIADHNALRRIPAATADLFGNPITEWLVEEYVTGRELAVNTFTVNGRHTVIDVWEYQQPNGPLYDNPYWDFLQIDADDPDRVSAAAFVVRLLDAFEIRHGPCHVEIKMTGRGPVLIEIGARLPGAGITNLWARHSTLRPYHDTIAVHLGRAPALPEADFDARLGMCFIRNDGPPGELRRLSGLREAGRLPGVEGIVRHARVGQFVPTTTDLGTELVKIWLSAPTRPALIDLIGRVRRTVRAEVA
jgi:biotin carboxylase